MTHYVRGSETSQAAAELIEPSAGTLRSVVLIFLRARGLLGATDEEMQETIPMPASTQRPRRVELVERGLIENSGFARRTHSGRRAVVWRAC